MRKGGSNAALEGRLTALDRDLQAELSEGEKELVCGASEVDKSAGNHGGLPFAKETIAGLRDGRCQVPQMDADLDKTALHDVSRRVGVGRDDGAWAFEIVSAAEICKMSISQEFLNPSFGALKKTSRSKNLAIKNTK